MNEQMKQELVNKWNKAMCTMNNVFCDNPTFYSAKLSGMEETLSVLGYKYVLDDDFMAVSIESA